MPGNPARSLCIDGRIIYVNIILTGYLGLHLTENVDGWQAVVDGRVGSPKDEKLLKQLNNSKLLRGDSVYWN